MRNFKKTQYRSSLFICLSSSYIVRLVLCFARAAYGPEYQSFHCYMKHVKLSLWLMNHHVMKT